MINVEFEGRNPESSDFHSVKQLLQQLFLKAQVNLSDMASLLINQRSFGSVIKVYNNIKTFNNFNLKCVIINLSKIQN